MSPLRFRSLLLLPAAVLASSCAMHLPEPAGIPSRMETRSMPVAAEEPSVDIYLLSDNLHTALVFDLQWLEESGYVKPPEVPNEKQVTMSWGEKTAYTQKRWLSPIQVFKALCTPSDSVMEIIPIDWKVNEVCHHQTGYVAKVERSRGPALAAFLNACAEKGPDGKPITIAPSSWGKGRLIQCPDNYSYYFPRICNVWTAQALGQCGFNVTTPGAVSASGLVRQAKKPENGFVKAWDGN
jgi:hypothetical protein